MNNYVWGNLEFAQGIRYERANYDVSRKTIRSSEKMMGGSFSNK